MKSVQMSEEVHEELKLYCVKSGRKVGAAVEVAVKFWLSHMKNKPGVKVQPQPKKSNDWYTEGEV